MNIETIRAEGISYNNVSLTYDAINFEWILKRHYRQCTGFIAWAALVHGSWIVCTPSSLNAFDPADVLAVRLTEVDAVRKLVEIGRQETTKAA